MKILAFTDMHTSERAFLRIYWKTKLLRPDILVCCGDLSVFEHGLDTMIRKIAGLGKEVVLIHGNHEEAGTTEKLCKKYKNFHFIHRKPFIFQDCLFLGYGGDGFSIIDHSFTAVGKKFAKIINRNPGMKKIFVTHAPPHNTQLDIIVDYHCGNKSIRNFDVRQNIDFHFCGHLHENFEKKDTIGKTRVINPGPYGKMVLV